MSADNRLLTIEIDETSLAPVSAEAEHERKIAVFDLLEGNRFKVVDAADGPYQLKLSLIDNRLVFDVSNEAGEQVRQILLSLTPLRRLIKDYFLICDSYYDAIRSSTPAQIEAIDMGRRGLHNEGSEVLIERLSGKVETDFDTARRLFTLVCALHMRN